MSRSVQIRDRVRRGGFWSASVSTLRTMGADAGLATNPAQVSKGLFGVKVSACARLLDADVQVASVAPRGVAGAAQTGSYENGSDRVRQVGSQTAHGDARDVGSCKVPFINCKALWDSQARSLDLSRHIRACCAKSGV